MSDQVSQFYDQLAENYHTIFADWKASVQRQAVALDGLIQQHKIGMPLTLLDCTCGIGTQAIGLALKDYTVHATDLSPEAVIRAEREAVAMKATLTFGVADLRTLGKQVAGEFDVVLAADNALAHFLKDEDLLLVAHNMAEKTAPGGLVLVSIRDYDRILQDKPHSTLPQATPAADGKRNVSFQVWDWWEDGRGYRLNHFTVNGSDADWHTTCGVTNLRAWERAEMGHIFTLAGFSDVRWHMPEETGFYQPIMTGLRGS